MLRQTMARNVPCVAATKRRAGVSQRAVPASGARYERTRHPVKSKGHNPWRSDDKALYPQCFETEVID